MTKQQFTEIMEWQRQTFGQASAYASVLHLKEEINELKIEIRIDGDGKRHEFADCFFLLFGAAAADGMSYEDICEAIQEKFEINKARKWGEPDADGVVKHIITGSHDRI